MRIFILFLILIVSSCGAPDNPKPKSRLIDNPLSLEGVPKGDFYKINRLNSNLKKIKLQNGGLLVYRLNESNKKIFLNLSKFKDARTTLVYNGLGKFIQGDIENSGYDKREFRFEPIESMREDRYFIDIKYSNSSLYKHILELDQNGNVLKKHTLLHPMKNYFWNQVKLKVVTSDNYLEVVSTFEDPSSLQVNIYDINFKYLYTKTFLSRHLKNCDDCALSTNFTSKKPRHEFLIYNNQSPITGYSLFRLKIRNDRLDVANLFGITHLKKQEFSSLISLNEGRLMVNFSEWNSSQAKTKQSMKSLYSLGTPLRGDSKNLSKFKIHKEDLDLNNQCIILHEGRIYQLYAEGRVRILDLNLKLVKQMEIWLSQTYKDYLAKLKSSQKNSNVELMNCKSLDDGLGADVYMKTIQQTSTGFSSKHKKIGYLSVKDLFLTDEK